MAYFDGLEDLEGAGRAVRAWVAGGDAESDEGDGGVRSGVVRYAREGEVEEGRGVRVHGLENWDVCRA